MTRPVVRFTLVADGSSDRVLARPLQWLLTEFFPCDHQFQFARSVRAEADLSKRMALAISDFPCDILLVHRDAERQPPENRESEIARASASLRKPLVKIVPVRMTEAWFMFDEAAIRQAAGRIHGAEPLDILTPAKARDLADPKEHLFGLLKAASGLSGRKLKRFEQSRHEKLHRVADLIVDYSPLLVLPEFATFRDSLLDALHVWRASG